jgi:predicted RNA-binding protein with TRAM domain
MKGKTLIDSLRGKWRVNVDFSQLQHAVAAAEHGSYRQAADNQLVRDGVLELDVFDCGREGAGKIVVSGEVVLVHPADVGNAGIQSIKSIRISCPNLEFLNS